MTNLLQRGKWIPGIVLKSGLQSQQRIKDTEGILIKGAIENNDGDDLGDEFMLIYHEPSVTELQITVLWNNLTKETFN